MAEKSKKRIVVYWSYFQNYHSARVREVLRLSKTSNWEVFPLALAGSANDHHQSELSDDLAGRVEVLVPERVDDPGCNPRVRAALKNLLDRVQPDIVMT